MSTNTTHRRRRLAAAALGGIVLGTVLITPPASATPYNGCSTAGSSMPAEPWAQKMLDPERVQQFTTGSGITVAVIDSGVDANQAQLAGHVAKGTVIKGSSTAKAANTDCAGSGTEVAGVIAAQHSTKTAFRGVAPGVTIVPIRVQDQVASESGEGSTADALMSSATEAKAIDAAVELKADVIVTPIVADSDSSALKSAVQLALNSGIVVVAAVGDNSNASTGRPSAYPACYQGVIGVGAITAGGTVISNQRPDSCVDLVAPGQKVTTTQRISGLVRTDGTHIAVAFVAATVALVEARFPDLTPLQVKQRLDATATPMAGGVDDKKYGHGLVNPYEAVTDTMATGSPAALPAMHPRHTSAAQLQREHAWSSSTRLAVILTSVGLLLALLTVLGAISIANARRHGWRPRQGPPPVDDPEADMPTPPVQLFKESETTR